MIYTDALTFEVILGELLENVPDTVDKREGSVIYDALAPVAQEIMKVYRELDVVMDETFADTASLQFLMMRCRERGVPIKDATSAVISAHFEPVDVVIPEGTRFNCDDQNYIIGEPFEGEPGDYRLTAETPGRGGNLHSGTLLPIDYVEGLTSARIITVMVPGEDEDNADTLRERYFASVAAAAFGGNKADYKERVNMIDGVGAVKVTPVWNGPGTVKLTILDSDYDIPSEYLVRSVQEAIDPLDEQGTGSGLAPIGHTVTVVGAAPEYITVRSRFTFAPGWNWNAAESSVRRAIIEYFMELDKEWENQTNTIVRISQIETRILSLPGVLDIADTTLNGYSRNLELDPNKIPCPGGVEPL